MVATMKTINYLAALSLISFSLLIQGVIAQEASDADTKANIMDRLESAGLGLEESAVIPSPISGYHQASGTSSNGETVIYLANDGEYFFAGDLFFLEPGRFVNATEAEKTEKRAQALAGVDPETMIVFPAVGEAKGILTVFTDVTCGYCRKLHGQMAEMNEAGIEVHYLAYPRSGIQRDGVFTHEYTETVKAWCAEDRNLVMTDLKAGIPVEGEICEENPVSDHYALGREFGVTGTPAIVLPDGTLMPGYRSTADYLALLGIEE